MLQMRRAKSLRTRLPGSGHEMLCLREAGTFESGLQSMTLTLPGSHLSRLHCPERRPTQCCRKDLLQVWPARAHLQGLHCRNKWWAHYANGLLTADTLIASSTDVVATEIPAAVPTATVA